jgi:hypothetical protein
LNDADDNRRVGNSSIAGGAGLAGNTPAGTSGISSPGGPGGSAAGGIAGIGGLGAAGTAAGGIAGQGAVTSIAGAQASGLLIDDMEDGTGRLRQGTGRVGVWYTFNDGLGTQQPAPMQPGTPIIPEAIPGGRASSIRAMHTVGTGFDDWGAGIGFDLAFDGTTYGVYDAGGYGGIRFWARSDINSTIFVRISTACTTSIAYGGTCILESHMTNPGGPCNPVFWGVELSQDWAEYAVSFVEAWTRSAYSVNPICEFESGALTNVQFMGSGGSTDPFDFWIDDVYFTPRTDPDCCPTPKPGCADVIAFADPRLAAQVKSLTGTVTGSLRCSDVCRLQSLTINDPQVRDLAGMECLDGLRTLTFASAYNVSDITPLSGLTGLMSLTIADTQVGDLRPLAGLTGLISLGLFGRSIIADLSPLANLTDLTSLDVTWTSVSDLTALAGLTNLNHVRLSHNQISDVTPLGNLRQVTYLNLSENRILEISPIVANSGFGAGDTLDITDNPLDCATQSSNVQTLIDRGVSCRSDCR